MSQLHLFLSVLEDAALEQLGQLHLKGKEKEVFHFSLSRAKLDFPDSDIVAEHFRLSKTHFYKLNSILLSKCFSTLYKEDHFALLLFLKQKGLFVLLRSEAKSAEKTILTRANNYEKEQFYLRMFHLYIDMPFKFFNKKSIQYYGKKYLEFKTDGNKSDQLYVEYHELFANCNRCAALKHPQKAFGISEKELLEKEPLLQRGKHYLALYYLYRTLISYYTYYERNTHPILHYLKKCIALKDSIAHFFPIDIGQLLNLMYADRLFAEQKIDDAYNIFKSEFDKGLAEEMYGYYYHCEQYCLLLIVHNKQKEALTILTRIFQPLIDRRADIMATRGCLGFAKLNLSNGNYKSALQWIQTGLSINEKSTYLPFEIQLRTLEVIALCRKKDFVFAEKAATRHLKFVTAQGDKTLLADYIDLFRLIIQFCKQRIKRKELVPTELAKLNEFNLRYLNIYCGLLGF